MCRIVIKVWFSYPYNRWLSCPPTFYLEVVFIKPCNLSCLLCLAGRIVLGHNTWLYGKEGFVWVFFDAEYLCCIDRSIIVVPLVPLVPMPSPGSMWWPNIGCLRKKEHELKIRWTTHCYYYTIYYPEKKSTLYINNHLLFMCGKLKIQCLCNMTWLWTSNHLEEVSTTTKK